MIRAESLWEETFIFLCSKSIIATLLECSHVLFLGNTRIIQWRLAKESFIATLFSIFLFMDTFLVLYKGIIAILIEHCSRNLNRILMFDFFACLEFKWYKFIEVSLELLRLTLLIFHFLVLVVISCSCLSLALIILLLRPFARLLVGGSSLRTLLDRRLLLLLNVCFWSHINHC